VQYLTFFLVYCSPYILSEAKTVFSYVSHGPAIWFRNLYCYAKIRQSVITVWLIRRIKRLRNIIELSQAHCSYFARTSKNNKKIIVGKKHKKDPAAARQSDLD